MFYSSLILLTAMSSYLRMVNGIVPTSAHPAAWSAVALVDKSTGEPFCSGTLVAQHLIVTASHCIFDKNPEDFQILFGAKADDPKAIRINPDALSTFKKAQKFESNFDIGWVRFQGDPPAGFHPIPIWHQPAVLQADTPVTIAGYGRSASQCAPDDAKCQVGQLQYVDTNVREFVNQGRLFDLIVIGPQPEHGPCFGDSGGPAYIQRDGQWFLVGNFMGWDRILVPEEMETICDTGEAIYNFVGSYVNWIEETSEQTLPYDTQKNPRLPPKTLDVLAQDPSDFQGWCRYNNHEDPAWFTMQRLIRVISDYRIQSGDAAGGRDIFENCESAENWLRKMLSETRKLEIGGFDPSTFIDSARLEDIRPLRVLQDMDLLELTLSDHEIRDLSPLNALTSLKKLSIVHNVTRDRRRLSQGEGLRIDSFPDLEMLQLNDPGPGVDLSGLTTLRKLTTLELNYVDASTLPLLEGLALKVLHLDTLNHAQPLDLLPLTQVQTLFLNKIALQNFPAQWSELESLDLLEVTGLVALPVDAPRLKRIFVYSSDLQGELKVGTWPAMEDASLFANSKVTQVSGLQDLPSLKFLEVSENPLLTSLAVRNMPNLVNLAIESNGIEVITELSGLPQLSKLHLDGNELSAVPPLAGLPALQYVDLSENPLQNLEGLHDLPGLKRLVLQNSQGDGLKQLQGMKNLPELTELNLTGNSLKSVDELVAFTQLKVLILNDNLLEDISALKALPLLEYLEVINNPLKERVCPIADKPDACRFDWLNFSENSSIIFPGSTESGGHNEGEQWKSLSTFNVRGVVRPLSRSSTSRLAKRTT